MKKTKKFNYALIVIISLITFYLLMFGNIEKSLYKYLIVLSIFPVMFLPYIIDKIFKIKISESIVTVYLIFLVLSYFLGSILNFYGKIWWYDKFVHTVSGFMSSFLALIILVKCKKHDKNSIVFNILFIILVALSVATLWEMFEFTFDNLFSKDAQKVKLTGVNDTMTDIIVAFLGSLMFSLFYAFEKTKNKKWVIKKFIKEID